MIRCILRRVIGTLCFSCIASGGAGADCTYPLGIRLPFTGARMGVACAMAVLPYTIFYGVWFGAVAGFWHWSYGRGRGLFFFEGWKRPTGSEAAATVAVVGMGEDRWWCVEAPLFLSVWAAGGLTAVAAADAALSSRIYCCAPEIVCDSNRWFYRCFLGIIRMSELERCALPSSPSPLYSRWILYRGAAAVAAACLCREEEAAPTLG